MTDESAVESDERHKNSDPENDFRSSFEEASSESSESSSDSKSNKILKKRLYIEDIPI